MKKTTKSMFNHWKWQFVFIPFRIIMLLVEGTIELIQLAASLIAILLVALMILFASYAVFWAARGFT